MITVCCPFSLRKIQVMRCIEETKGTHSALGPKQTRKQLRTSPVLTNVYSRTCTHARCNSYLRRRIWSWLSCSMGFSARFCTTLVLFLLTQILHALKFDIQAHPGHESASKERCIRNFVAKDTLVVVTATVSGSKGDGQVLNMHVCAPLSTIVR